MFAPPGILVGDFLRATLSFSLSSIRGEGDLVFGILGISISSQDSISSSCTATFPLLPARTGDLLFVLLEEVDSLLLFLADADFVEMILGISISSQDSISSSTGGLAALLLELLVGLLLDWEDLDCLLSSVALLLALLLF